MHRIERAVNGQEGTKTTKCVKLCYKYRGTFSTQFTEALYPSDLRGF